MAAMPEDDVVESIVNDQMAADDCQLIVIKTEMNESNTETKDVDGNKIFFYIFFHLSI